jgi:hypothetical protein
LKIIAENTCLDTAVDTSNTGMKYTGVVTAPRDVRVAFVEQEPPMLPGTFARPGTAPDLVNLTFLSFQYVCLPV